MLKLEHVSSKKSDFLFLLKKLKKLMLINVKFQISILDFNFFHMDPPLD